MKLLGVAVKTETGSSSATIRQRCRARLPLRRLWRHQRRHHDGAGMPPIAGPGAGGAPRRRRFCRYCRRCAGHSRIAVGRPVEKLKATTKAPVKRHEGYYIRLMYRYRSDDCRPARRQKISIESVQRHPDGAVDLVGKRQGSAGSVILITYATSEDAVHRALRLCSKTGYHRASSGDPDRRIDRLACRGLYVSGVD